MQADKIPQQKKQPASHSRASQQSGKSAVQFTDNRPEAIAQRQLQEAINNSPAVQQMKAWQEIADNSPQVKQLKARQAIARDHTVVQRKPIPVVQRVIDETTATAIARHIVEHNSTVNYKKLKVGSKYIRNALASIVPAPIFDETKAELDLLKRKIKERKDVVAAEKVETERIRKENLSNFYKLKAGPARDHLDTLSLDQVTALGATARVFRSYNTSWGPGSEYIFITGDTTIAQFVAHVHWNADDSRSGVRLKDHTDKTRSKPGLRVIDDEKAKALSIPASNGSAEKAVMEVDLPVRR